MPHIPRRRSQMDALIILPKREEREVGDERGEGERDGLERERLTVSKFSCFLMMASPLLL